jgi:tRNA(fMet)-specific endonuclease VapC
MNRILLDTNAYVRLLAGDAKVLDALAGAERIFMSVFVLGELSAGFRGGGKNRENTLRLERFLQKPGVEVLEATRETADYFGLVKNSLRKSGTPIPVNDVWIASHALETGSVLVTYDSHFRAVAGLRIWESE